MIKEKINELLTQLPTRVRLIAVSKTKPVAAILEAYEAGQRDFGENKVQELVEKEAQLPKDIRWHLIGHLQTNKVKYAASFVYLIHAVDSLKLLQEIDKQAKKNSRIQKVLLQFYIAQEETKFGLELNEAKALLDSSEYQALQNIEICGVMGMASFTDDDAQVRIEFEKLHAIFNELQASYFAEQATFSEISMGMSGDYQLAIEAGSTMIRVGSSIFGGR
jgi:pyridoxal phosphate enzyme (YggS family)